MIELKGIDPQENLQKVVVPSKIKDQSNLFDENHLSNFLSLDVNKIRQHTFIDHAPSCEINESLQLLASFYVTKRIIGTLVLYMI